jgi:hypothetical protein
VRARKHTAKIPRRFIERRLGRHPKAVRRSFTVRGEDVGERRFCHLTKKQTCGEETKQNHQLRQRRSPTSKWQRGWHLNDFCKGLPRGT